MRTLGSLLLAFALAACGADGAPPSTSEPVADPAGSWRLTVGTLDGVPVPIVADGPITLTIEGSEVGGTSACNSYGGRLSVEAGRLEIGELGMTAMACPDDVMAAEAAYTRALDRVDGLRRDGDELVLVGPDVELRFEPLPEPPTAELVDTAWVLDSVFVGDVAAAPAGDPATLELDSDGTLNGSTGCRSFTGTWVEQGEQIVATSLAMDGAECPAGLQAQDGHVVSVVGDGFVPTLERDLLTLTDPGGVGLVYRDGG
jgi:heat shock protein HslJ